MIAKIIQEATDAVVAAVQGVDDILDAITGSVKDQVVNVLQGAGEITGDRWRAISGGNYQKCPP